VKTKLTYFDRFKREILAAVEDGLKAQGTGAAVIELLRVVTGFAGTADPPARLSFDFESGTVRRNRLDSDPCSICAEPRRSSEGTGRKG